MYSNISQPILGLFINLWFIFTICYVFLFNPALREGFLVQPYHHFISLELVAIVLSGFFSSALRREMEADSPWNKYRILLIGGILAVVILSSINQLAVTVYFVVSVLTKFFAKPLERVAEEKEQVAVAIRGVSFLSAIFFAVAFGNSFNFWDNFQSVESLEIIGGLFILAVYHIVYALTTYFQNWTKYAYTFTFFLPFIFILLGLILN